jgi:hypothetical protein
MSGTPQHLILRCKYPKLFTRDKEVQPRGKYDNSVYPVDMKTVRTLSLRFSMWLHCTF